MPSPIYMDSDAQEPKIHPGTVVKFMEDSLREGRTFRYDMGNYELIDTDGVGMLRARSLARLCHGWQHIYPRGEPR